jgi:N-acetyl-anhydromuramyl-L-alanine amidase AmpD
VCDVAKRWQIPRDRLHIVSHAQLQPHNRTDPGSGWPWADYLARINRYCDG